MKRVSVTNILAVLAALYIGISCSGCSQFMNTEQYTGQQPSLLEFKNARPLIAGPYERGVWSEVEAVLHERADIDAIRLALADSIIDKDKHQLLYGAYAWVDWTDGTYPTVVIDVLVRWNTRVWSHEFCHVIGGFADGDYKLAACVLHDGPYALPERPLDPLVGEQT